MADLRILTFLLFLLCFADIIMSKIVLPHKLRYLENMLNADMIAKSAKIRQRMEANPNNQDSEKSWPLLLAKYQADDKRNMPEYSYDSLYARRIPNL
ncbi:uncharacterized protein LOC123880099 [Maniola jurtina]|uniref:uncharacterized protein LOC123880099 n=1 Tax=Maniola jurtina TaxID=191418 RepID=UPI001E686A84|nr:uncharacterized protein LOC123880099 [Maniola jurtina]